MNIGWLVVMVAAAGVSLEVEPSLGIEPLGSHIFEARVVPPRARYEIRIVDPVRDEIVVRHALGRLSADAVRVEIPDWMSEA